MYGSMKSHLSDALNAIEADGLFKKERVIVSVQDAAIRLDDGREVLNFCANNYLGLSSHPRVVEAAKRAIDERGFGMSSVRFICGTQDLHKELEKTIDMNWMGMVKGATLYFTLEAKDWGNLP